MIREKRNNDDLGMLNVGPADIDSNELKSRKTR